MIAWTALDLLQLALALWLAVHTFGRLLRTNAGTLAPIRHALAFLFASALAVAGSPWAWAMPARWPVILLVAAILVVQMATSRYWRAGVPRSFQTNPGELRADK